ncbi:MAG: T9SS type A sorting domain-containing protein [Chitinophagaceae bacterium]|nr:T9SS type A sorting domain-containing protein [Chitinophagaceae bacterium]
MRKINLLLLIILRSSFAVAQITAPDIAWQKTIGGNGTDQLYAVIQTIDDGYLLGGYSSSGISGDKTEVCQGNNDYWAIKLDATGNMEWQNTIGGSAIDNLYNVIESTDGGYFLVGTSGSGISGDKTEAVQGLWEVKLDGTGSIAWQKSSSVLYFDKSSAIQTSDGGYLVGCTRIDWSDYDTDYFVVKLDASGNFQWQNTMVGGYTPDYLHAIVQSDDGGYLLCGSSSGGNGPDYYNDYLVVKLDASGNTQWENYIGGDSYDELYSVVKTADGGYLLGGYSYSGISGEKTEASQGSNDYWVVRLDAAGSIQWQNTIGGSGEDMLHAVVLTSDNGYLLGGTSASGISGDKTEASKGSSDYWVVKLDVSGNIEWQKTIGGDLLDDLNSLEQSTDGSYLLGGYSSSGISGDKTEVSKGGNDYWVVKLNASVVSSECQVPSAALTVNITGTTAKLKWQTTPGALSYKVRYKVAGTSEWTTTKCHNNNKALQALAAGTEYVWQVKSICEIDLVVSSEWSEKQFFTTDDLRLSEMADDEMKFSVYPNPISSSATVTFFLSKESNVTIEMMDVNGRSLRVITKKDFSAGNHEVIFNRESLVGGIYFLQLKTNEGVMRKKLILLH